MDTKPLIRQHLVTVDRDEDLGSVCRLLTAAAHSCWILRQITGYSQNSSAGWLWRGTIYSNRKNLEDFGDIHASTLSEFIFQLDAGLSHRLLYTGQPE